MKTSLAKYVSGLLLLGAITAATAQSTWNYFISDAGGGNSLVTWSVSGSLATAPGAVVVANTSLLAVPVSAPGIYNDSYAASGTLQSLSTPDGSYFQLYPAEIYSPVVGYLTSNAAGGGNDIFELSSAPLPPHAGDAGHEFLYNPGTLSALIPVDYSDFNPGTYQSQVIGFNSPLTVNLTVGPVPEPSTLALSALSGLGGLLFFRRRKV
jgi:hypothetical protein